MEAELIQKVDRLEAMLAQVLDAVTQPEEPLSTAAAAKELFPSSKWPLRMMYTRVDNGLFRLGHEYLDDGAPAAQNKQYKFFVGKCRERMATPKHLL